MAGLVGGRVTEVTHGDKRVRYSEGNQGALDAEIRRLQAIVNNCNGCPDRFIQMTPSDC